MDKKICNCKNFMRLSNYKVVYASIVGKKIRAANFHDIFEGKICGVVLSAQIFIYECGYDGCGRTCDMLGRAFDETINDNVDIISMSLRMGRVACLKVKDDIGRKM